MTSYPADFIMVLLHMAPGSAVTAWLQVPSELRLPDLKEGGRGGMSLEQQLRMEAEDLMLMQTMARNNQRCVCALCFPPIFPALHHSMIVIQILVCQRCGRGKLGGFDR
jgi:hypothetical protein